MAKDLNMDVKIRIMPIVREADGLAMSSRNRYLSKADRKNAAILYKSLKAAKGLINAGARDADRVIQAIKRMITSTRGACVDYISAVDIRNLMPVKRIKGRVLIAL